MPNKRKPGNQRKPVPTEDQKRFVATMQEYFSGDNLRAYLDDNPEGVTKLLACTFRRNHLTHKEREAIGKELHMKLTGKAPAQRLAKTRKPANGGLPKIPA